MEQQISSFLPEINDHPIENKNLPARQDVLGGGVRRQIDFMASHMMQQYKEYQEAETRTGVLFETLLCQLEEVMTTFQEAFNRRNIPAGRVYVEIDADRSIGILHILWHTVSFTTRGNTKPMALKRSGRDPLFSGRIVALLGDFRENVVALASQEFNDILEDELASLFVPASPTQPALMQFRHRREEFFFHPAEATQQFLVKVLESLCGGGYYHEVSD